MKKSFLKIFFGISIFILLLPTIKVILPELRFLVQFSNADIENEFTHLQKLNYPIYQIGQYINTHTNKSEKFLVFRVGDFAYYFKRYLISYFDPELLDLYKAQNKDLAYKKLLELGISYIYLPPYDEPAIYNTQLGSLLSDLRYTELLVNIDGYRLFKVREKPHSFKITNIETKDNMHRFYNYNAINIMKNPQPLYNKLGGLSYIKSSLRKNGIFFGDASDSTSGKQCFRIHPGAHIINVGIKGSANLKIEVIEYDINGKMLSNSNQEIFQIQKLFYLFAKNANNIIKKMLLYKKNIPKKYNSVYLNYNLEGIKITPAGSYYLRNSNATIQTLYTPSDKAKYVNIIVTNVGINRKIEVNHIRLITYKSKEINAKQ